MQEIIIQFIAEGSAEKITQSSQNHDLHDTEHDTRYIYISRSHLHTLTYSHSLTSILCLISSADPQVSSAELMVLLICPSSVVVRHRPSVNFCFKSLLLLQFLFDHSEFFTGETRHIVPPCNKAGISNFCLEFQKLQKFQISWKRYSSFSSYSIILKFILEKLGI